MPFCIQCGRQIVAEGRFCNQCGVAVNNVRGDFEVKVSDAGRSTENVLAVIQTIEGVDQKLLHSPQVGYLAAVLDEHEVPESIVSIVINECLVATDVRIIHVQKPIFGSGFKSESFSYDHVLSVEKHRMFRGQLTIHLSTGKSKSIVGINGQHSCAFADLVNSKLRPINNTIADSPSSTSWPRIQPKHAPPAHSDREPIMDDSQGRVSGQPTKEEAIDAALRRISGFGRFLTRGEIKELPFVLWEGELPVMLADGFYNNGTGLLVATDRRLIFIDKGLFGTLKVEDFGYNRITSIESNVGIFSGKIVIYASGNREQIDHVSKQDVHSLASFLRSKIFSPNNSPLSSQFGTMSTAKELARYSVLLDNGVITQEEFDSLKTRLLGS